MPGDSVRPKQIKSICLNLANETNKRIYRPIRLEEVLKGERKCFQDIFVVLKSSRKRSTTGQVNTNLWVERVGLKTENRSRARF